MWNSLVTGYKFKMFIDLSYCRQFYIHTYTSGCRGVVNHNLLVAELGLLSNTIMVLSSVLFVLFYCVTSN